MPGKRKEDEFTEALLEQVTKEHKVATKQEEAFLTLLDVPCETSLYIEGKAYLEQKLDVLIKPDSSAFNTCYLAFYNKRSPSVLPGLVHDPAFVFGEPLSPAKYDALLSKWRDTLKDMPSIAMAQFWYPVMATSAFRQSRPPIEQYIAKKLGLESAYSAQYEGTIGFEQGIAISPALALAKGEVPRAYIPESDWFDDSIKKLHPSDIITLMPEAELELFMLFLGRTVCGRANSRPIGEDSTLSHQFRKMAVLYGKDPRTGKSTTCGLINKVLKLLGYSVANFRGLGNRFNMAPIYQSDLAFKDDATQASAEAILSQESAKMLISGAQMRVEDKGKQAFNITPYCTVIFITNELDQNLLFKKDSGVIDRLAILYTYSHTEQERLQIDTPYGISPNPRPYEHLNWLAEQAETVPEVLIMWLLRQAADKFMASISQSRLEADIARHTDKLRFPIAHQVLPNVIGAMLLSHLLRHKNVGVIPLSNKRTLAYVLQAFSYIVGDLNAHYVRCLVKDDWIERGRPSLHPWHGIKLISKVSIARLTDMVQQVLNRQEIDLDAMLKTCFSQLQTTQNIHVGSSPYYIKRSWQDACGTAYGDMLEQIASSVLQKHKAIAKLSYVHEQIPGNSTARLDYTEIVGYDANQVCSSLHNFLNEAEGPIDFYESYKGWQEARHKA